MERRTFLWLWNGLDALEEPRARGMHRESASVSLAKIAGTTPHILHLTLLALRAPVSGPSMNRFTGSYQPA